MSPINKETIGLGTGRVALTLQQASANAAFEDRGRHVGTADTGAGLPKKSGRLLKVLLQPGEKFGDGFLIARVEDPLAHAPRGDESDAVKGPEMGGDGRLRQAAPIELAGTDAHLKGVFLRREMLFRRFQPSQDF